MIFFLSFSFNFPVENFSAKFSISRFFFPFREPEEFLKKFETTVRWWKSGERQLDFFVFSDWIFCALEFGGEIRSLINAD
jgi:hypothetical protein